MDFYHLIEEHHQAELEALRIRMGVRVVVHKDAAQARAVQNALLYIMREADCVVDLRRPVGQRTVKSRDDVDCPYRVNVLLGPYRREHCVDVVGDGSVPEELAGRVNEIVRLWAAGGVAC